MTETMLYRAVTYKNGIPFFGEWTNLFAAHDQAQACKEYSWVENELHERISNHEIMDKMAEREG